MYERSGSIPPPPTEGIETSEPKNQHIRKAGGTTWSDPSLDEWPENDFRIFCGDLGHEVTSDMLGDAFKHLKSFQKAKVVRDARTGKNRGYGFVSFSDPQDMLKALRTMDGKYVGNRPIKLRKSRWQERESKDGKVRVGKSGAKVRKQPAKTTRLDGTG